MGAIELRDKIIQSLNTDNVSFLQNVFEFVKKEKENTSDHEIVAYTVQGQPLNKKEYIRQIKEADAEIDKGEYITVEDLEKESAGW
ncbi:MAG: hypothetical protein GKR88_11460 [Flavobacteriaceae bacterium]|nr:MAG: hypothetical protein GKR88_11460 [Flavobacteriaceae bacterium]